MISASGIVSLILCKCNRCSGVQSAQRSTPCWRAISPMTTLRKFPPFVHSAITFLVIAWGSRPEQRPSLLSSQASISFSLFAFTPRSPNRGSSRLMAFDSVRYRAKFPADRIMWYRSVVPERPHPSTKTGALLRAVVSLLRSTMSCDSMFPLGGHPHFAPVLSRSPVQAHPLDAVGQFLGVVFELNFRDCRDQGMVIAGSLGHQRQKAFHVSFFPQQGSRRTRAIVRGQHRNFQPQRLQHRRTNAIRNRSANVRQGAAQQGQESIMRHRCQQANRIFNLLVPHEVLHAVHLAIPGPDQQESHPREFLAKSPDRLRQKLQRELLAKTYIAEKNSVVLPVKFLDFPGQRRRGELDVIGRKVRDRLHPLCRYASREQDFLDRLAVAVNPLWNSKQERKRPIAERSPGCGKVTLLMPSAIGKQRRSSRHAGQQQRGERQEISLLGLPIHAHVNRISPPNVAQDLPEIVRPALHIDVLRARDPPVFVQVHHLAVPSPRFQFLAQAYQAHRPAAHRRRPVPDFQNAFVRFHVPVLQANHPAPRSTDRPSQGLQRDSLSLQ